MLCDCRMEVHADFAPANWRNIQHRTSRRTTHVRCRRGCRVHIGSARTVLLAPAHFSTVRNNWEVDPAAYFPRDIERRPRRRELRVPIRPPSANDIAGP